MGRFYRPTETLRGPGKNYEFKDVWIKCIITFFPLPIKIFKNNALDMHLTPCLMPVLSIIIIFFFFLIDWSIDNPA